MRYIRGVSFSSKDRRTNGIVLLADGGLTQIHVEVVRETVIRVFLKRKRPWNGVGTQASREDASKVDFSFALDRTWSMAPSFGCDASQDTACPLEGRPRQTRSDVDADISAPHWELSTNSGIGGKDESPSVSVSTGRLRVVLNATVDEGKGSEAAAEPNANTNLGVLFCMRWFWNNNGTWEALASDKKTGGILLGRRNDRIEHFMDRCGGDMFFGLGGRTGNVNKAGRRYEMRSLDAMGYDAESTDPLYKHFPFYITRPKPHAEGAVAAYGLFYDNMSTCAFDLGNELDNYHGWYKSYKAQAGDFDMYMILGPKVADVTTTFCAMSGRTILSPRWALGYSGSTMSYTDASNAQERLSEYLQLCKQHDMPCSSFHLSSGYSSIGTKRYVFTWNKEKVPDPHKLSRDFAVAGIRLLANIKPCLLQDHPKYEELRKAEMFVLDSDALYQGERFPPRAPERSVFWDDEGSHLDFTNPKTFGWWKQNVTEQLLEKGIVSTWNDNNEYEIWDEDAQCNGFGRSISIKLIRPLHSLLMMRASFEAQVKHNPTERPMLISRSGMPGMHRYVQTWTGDNYTSWKTLRYNIRMGIGLSLSGLYNFGHDVGGFSGPAPEPELFVRWVQNGIFHPRFSIHSWNTDATVNEPWMHERVTHLVRDAMKFRYRLLPFFYSQLWLAHVLHQPILRPTFYDHESDPKVWEENDDFMLGNTLLVASVVEPQQSERQVYFPENGGRGWHNFYTGQWHSGGSICMVPTNLETVPLFVASGSGVPMSEGDASAAVEGGKIREIRMYPSPPDTAKRSAESRTIVYDDDGITTRWNGNECCVLVVEMRSTASLISLDIQRYGKWVPLYENLHVVIPAKTLQGRDVHINIGHEKVQAIDVPGLYRGPMGDHMMAPSDETSVFCLKIADIKVAGSWREACHIREKAAAAVVGSGDLTSL